MPAWAADRHLVLAVGSNGAPEQLVRKLRSCTEPRVVVLEASVADHDVVYAARVASYGAVPATLTPSPGTTVTVKATLLDAEQRQRMDDSEALGRAYRRGVLAPASVTLRPSHPVTAEHYAAIGGPLRLGGAPVALAALPATGRRWPALSQEALLGRLAAAVGWSAAELAGRLASDARLRARLNAGGLSGDLLVEVANT